MSSQTAPYDFATTLRPHYGVLVTEKSYVLAHRRLADNYHARYLAHRIIGDRIPAELIDEVADRLSGMLFEGSKRKWKLWSYPYGLESSTKADCAASAQIQQVMQSSKMRLHPHFMTVSRPEGLKVENTYVHLSATIERPRLSNIVPGLVTRTGGSSLRYAKGDLKVSCNDRYDIIEVNDRGEEGQAQRLIQLDGVEEAIREWNQELVDRVIAELGLRLVTIEGEEGGGAKARLRLLQYTQWR